MTTLSEIPLTRIPMRKLNQGIIVKAALKRTALQENGKIVLKKKVIGTQLRKIRFYVLTNQIMENIFKSSICQLREILIT
jgi:hypothetical protein